jgi:hypothetical protein
VIAAEYRVSFLLQSFVRQSPSKPNIEPAEFYAVSLNKRGIVKNSQLYGKLRNAAGCGKRPLLMQPKPKPTKKSRKSHLPTKPHRKCGKIRFYSGKGSIYKKSKPPYSTIKFKG